MVVEVDPNGLNTFKNEWPGITEGNMEGVIKFLESEGIDSAPLKHYLDEGIYSWELNNARGSTVDMFNENLCKVCAVVVSLEGEEKDKFVKQVGFGDQWACLEGAISVMEAALETRGTYLSKVGGQYLTEESVKCFESENSARANGQHGRGVLKTDMGDWNAMLRDDNISFTAAHMDYRKRKEVLDAYPQHIISTLNDDMCTVLNMVQNSIDEEGIVDAQLWMTVQMNPLMRELDMWDSYDWFEDLEGDETMSKFQLKEGVRESFVKKVENYANELGLKLPIHEFSRRQESLRPVWVEGMVG